MMLQNQTQPTQQNWLEAAYIVAEIMLHVGRGHARAAGSAPLPDIAQSDFAEICKGFLTSTANSLAGGEMTYEGGWTNLPYPTRDFVLQAAFEMGKQIKKLHEDTTTTVPYKTLYQAMKEARALKCPEKTHGGGPTCNF
jgi:hypothetical protein